MGKRPNSTGYKGFANLTRSDLLSPKECPFIRTSRKLVSLEIAPGHRIEFLGVSDVQFWIEGTAGKCAFIVSKQLKVDVLLGYKFIHVVLESIHVQKKMFELLNGETFTIVREAIDRCSI